MPLPRQDRITGERGLLMSSSSSALNVPLAQSHRRGLGHAKLRLRSSFSRWRALMPLLSLLSLLALWQLAVSLEIYPSFIIPSPSVVWAKFLQVAADGTLWHHTSMTLYQMATGLVLGLSAAFVLGLLIAQSRTAEDLLSPVIVAFQSTPTIAYAPLLVIWFGSGPTSKIVTCAIIVFFPSLMTALSGLRNVPQDLRDLMRLFNANRWQRFVKLELPAALPTLLTGLKTSATLALIGSVVGEFVSSNRGLGFLVNVARNQYDTPLVFVTIFTMTALSLSLYVLVSALERRLLSRRAPTHAK